jgi:nicotinamidase-related amidase/tRNA(Arg) A34 adenosine deaminase TadA
MSETERARDEALIERAIVLANRAKSEGEPPFGALVADAEGRIVSEATDEVRAQADFTQHAEVNAVRRACRARGKSLERHTLYTTVEPCPMCFTATWLARIDRVVFGATMAAVREMTGGAQRELVVGARVMNDLSGEPIFVQGGVLAARCLAPFERLRQDRATKSPAGGDEAHEPRRTRRNTALLLIDFQRDFCDEGGYADRLLGSRWARDVVPQAERLLRAARTVGLCVVHTREGYAPDLSDCTAQRRIRSRHAGAGIGDPGPLGRFLIRGEAGHAFVPALEPQGAEIVIDKPSYGAFVGTRLEETLRERGIEHLYLAGVTADVCVHTTLREATDRGFFCHYVRDAISTFDTELRRACERMVSVEGGIWGRVVETEQSVRELDRMLWREATSEQHGA